MLDCDQERLSVYKNGRRLGLSVAGELLSPSSGGGGGLLWAVALKGQSVYHGGGDRVRVRLRKVTPTLSKAEQKGEDAVRVFSVD
jgi:hypothetical protein